MTQPRTQPTQPALTREDLIYLWKTEGGNLPWARWAKIHGIPEHNPGFIEGLKIIEKKSCTKAHSPVNSGEQKTVCKQKQNT